MFKPQAHSANPTTAKRRRRTLGGQGNPAGARRAARMLGSFATLPLKMSQWISRMRLASSCFIVAVFSSMPSFADQLSKLSPGVYVDARIGCSGLGGAGTMSFDGANFSGHYQVCKTDPTQDGRYVSTCIEAQGPKWPTIADIAKSPDKTTENFTLAIISPKSFKKNSTTYNYCGAQ